jgi:hypothetical protein
MWGIYRAHTAWNMDVASYCIRLDRRQLAEGTYHDLEVAKGIDGRAPIRTLMISDLLHRFLSILKLLMLSC